MFFVNVAIVAAFPGSALDPANDLVPQLLELFLPWNLFSLALSIFEATDYDPLGRVDCKITRINSPVTGRIRFLNIAELDTRVTEGSS